MQDGGHDGIAALLGSTRALLAVDCCLILVDVWRSHVEFIRTNREKSSSQRRLFTLFSSVIYSGRTHLREYFHSQHSPLLDCWTSRRSNTFSGIEQTLAYSPFLTPGSFYFIFVCWAERIKDGRDEHRITERLVLCPSPDSHSHPIEEAGFFTTAKQAFFQWRRGLVS